VGDMRRLTIHLDEETARHLEEAAWREWRPLRLQAVVLLRRALGLETEGPAASLPQQPAPNQHGGGAGDGA